MKAGPEDRMATKNHGPSIKDATKNHGPSIKDDEQYEALRRVAHELAM